jgi:hypothetical protein
MGTPAASKTSLGPTPLCIRRCGLPIAPPAIRASFFTPTRDVGAPRAVAHSTATTLSPEDPEVVFENMRRVAVALGRMAKLDRKGSGSIYAEREYERVQLEGLIDDVAMKPPHPAPPLESGDGGIPDICRVIT